MLTCKKCHNAVFEGTAQQTFTEIEAALAESCSQIEAYRRAMKLGPLCDGCLEHWREKHLAAADTRSPALKRVAEACLALGAGEARP